MGIRSSGCAAVDAMESIKISGNVTHPRWYREILRDNGRPDHFAVALLSDIVYWYRPVVERDESTGQVIALRKKFKGDLLQKTYEQYAEQFGESKRVVKAALDRLEDLKLIKKVLRDIVLPSGLKIPNVMYIAINPERIAEISREEIDPPTSGPTDQKSEDSTFNEVGDIVDNSPKTAENQGFVGYPTKFCTTPYAESYDPLQNNATSPTQKSTHILRNSDGYHTTVCGTNTENTTGTINEITTEINNGECDPVQSCPAGDDEAWMEQVSYSKPIRIVRAEQPEEKKHDGQDMREAYIRLLKDQVEYDRLCQEDIYHDQMNIVDGIINIIADIATTEPPDGYERINGRQYPHQVVVSRLTKMDYETLTHVLGRFKENKSEIKNMRSYLLTALYNARDEKDIQFQNFFNHSYYGTDWSEKR